MAAAAVPITSESATREPTALSQLSPALWRTWSTSAMKAIGIATDRIRIVMRRSWRLRCPGSSCCFVGGDRGLRAVEVAVVEAQRSPSELPRLGVAPPGHRDHEGDREHPSGHPDRRADQEPEGGLQSGVGRWLVFGEAGLALGVALHVDLESVQAPQPRRLEGAAGPERGERVRQEACRASSLVRCSSSPRRG